MTYRATNWVTNDLYNIIDSFETLRNYLPALLSEDLIIYLELRGGKSNYRIFLAKDDVGFAVVQHVNKTSVGAFDDEFPLAQAVYLAIADMEKNSGNLDF